MLSVLQCPMKRLEAGGSHMGQSHRLADFHVILLSSGDVIHPQGLGAPFVLLARNRFGSTQRRPECVACEYP